MLCSDICERPKDSDRYMNMQSNMPTLNSGIEIWKD